jgi:nitronate monooxygenase/enoyl-[acyl-carrier protein] reductase II
MLAPMGSATSAAFAAAMSNAGGLGGIGTFSRESADILDDLSRIRGLTDRPFNVNHVPQHVDEAAFVETLRLQPAVISFSLGDPGEMVAMAQAAGAKVMLQVTTVNQALLGAERGVDVIIAQGSEAGGFGGMVSTMVLVPQVVEAVAPIPVIAAGGIFDGRGLAAALMLGAVGVNMGTRFLASREAPISQPWQEGILSAKSEDAVKAYAVQALETDPEYPGFQTVLRSLRTPFLDQWNDRPDEVAAQREALNAQLESLWESGRGHEVVMTAGQSAGAIRDIRPLAEIVADVVREAELALRRATEPLA